jgi:hypothetical protein
MREAAMAELHRWLREVDNPDPEQRAWKLAYAEGVIAAYERVGVLSSDEAKRWRARTAAPERPSPAFTDERGRAAAERHLEELLSRVLPFRRDPDPADLAAGEECSAAIDALAAAGVLDHNARAGWRRRLLAAQAPWLDDAELPEEGWSAYAVQVPAQNEAEAAQDAAREAAQARQPQRREVRRVVTGSPARQGGLAIVALVEYEDCAELHFHQLVDVPDPESETPPLGPFREALEGLAPPLLRDDSGTAYQPVFPRPGSAGGRMGAIGGSWLYTPAPPPGAAGFTATDAAGELSWRLGP